MRPEKICVMGLGYIGLPTAALLANRGFDVHGVDVVQSVVDTINRGEVHIVEPELDAFVNAAVKSSKLLASTEPAEADVFIVAVPTPFREGNVPNLDYVVKATQSIAPYLKAGNKVILESTSSVGTTELMQQTLEELGCNTTDIHLAHCPERVLPGHVMRELIENDRIVGGINEASTKEVADFYRKFVKGEVLETHCRMAEMAKLTENSFRDVNIAFANELSIICDELELNVWELIRLANKHPRVNILQPGPGVGGHCIAVDPWFIVDKTPERAKIIRQAREINDYKPGFILEKVDEAVEQHGLKQPVIGCLGLAFKPDIDDLRESPALNITKRLAGKYHVLASEPNLDEDINEHNSRLIEGLDLRPTDEVLAKADVVVILVNHKPYYELEPEMMRKKILIDTKGIFQWKL